MELENCAQTAPGMGIAGRPSGFRRLTPGMMKVNRLAEAFAEAPSGRSGPGQLLAAFKAAAPRLGLSVRLVHAVDWLFRFTQPQDWEEGARPIVWPSAELQREAFGLSTTQVKAINRTLIEAGLLTMRDSPNGKRYGCRDRQHRIVEAYGFDLSPLAARHAEFQQLATEAQAERALMGRLRRRATIARKGIAQLLETALEYGHRGPEWAQLAADTRELVRVLRVTTCPRDLETGVLGLERRQDVARQHLETLLGVVETDPKRPENRPHNIATNEDLNLSDTVIAHQGSSSIQARPAPPPRPRDDHPVSGGMPTFNLKPAELVRLAPRLRPFLRRVDPTWPDVVDAADCLRSELDISKPLWGEACLLLGRETAAVAVAIVSAKDPASLRSAGGYFYGMLAKAKAHELHLDRTIWKMRTAGQAKGGNGAGQGRPPPETETLSTPQRRSDRQESAKARRGVGKSLT